MVGAVLPSPWPVKESVQLGIKALEKKTPRRSARFFSLMERSESSCFWLVLFLQSKLLRVARFMSKALGFLYDFYDHKILEGKRIGRSHTFLQSKRDSKGFLR